MIPFLKKKDKSYKLNDYELPKLSDASASSPDSPPLETPTPDVPSAAPLDSSASNDTLFPSQEATPSFNDPGLVAPNAFSSPVPSQGSPDFSSDSVHSEVSRVKIDAMESKLSLLDAKMSTIDAKLSFIVEVLEKEMSDETREELRKTDISSSLRKRGIR